MVVRWFALARSIPWGMALGMAWGMNSSKIYFNYL